jgi:hypothetical protein
LHGYTGVDGYGHLFFIATGVAAIPVAAILGCWTLLVAWKSKTKAMLSGAVIPFALAVGQIGILFGSSAIKELLNVLLIPLWYITEKWLFPLGFGIATPLLIPVVGIFVAAVWLYFSDWNKVTSGEERTNGSARSDT